MHGIGMPEVMNVWFISLSHVVKQGWAAGLTDDMQRGADVRPCVLSATSSAGSSVTTTRSAWRRPGVASLNGPRQVDSSTYSLVMAAARPRSGCIASRDGTPVL